MAIQRCSCLGQVLDVLLMAVPEVSVMAASHGCPKLCAQCDVF